jgi:hypothetical protein
MPAWVQGRGAPTLRPGAGRSSVPSPSLHPAACDPQPGRPPSPPPTAPSLRGPSFQEERGQSQGQKVGSPTPRPLRGCLSPKEVIWGAGLGGYPGVPPPLPSSPVGSLRKSGLPHLPLEGQREGTAYFQRQFSPWNLDNFPRELQQKGSASRSLQISWHLKEKRTLTAFEGSIGETAPPVPWLGGHWGPGNREYPCPTDTLFPSSTDDQSQAEEKGLRCQNPACMDKGRAAKVQMGIWGAGVWKQEQSSHCPLCG